MKNRKNILLIVLLLPLAAFIAFHRYYPVYDAFIYQRARDNAEETVQQVPQLFQALFVSQGEKIQDIADMAISFCKEDKSYAFHRSSRPISSTIHSQSKKGALDAMIKSILNELQDFDTSAELLLDSVFTPTEDLFYYPKESCIFRYHLMIEDEVAYQADLIYSPCWEEHKQNKLIHDPFGSDLSIKITENWYVVILNPK